MLHRKKILYLTRTLTDRHGIDQWNMCRGDSININKVVKFLEKLANEKELLPRDVVLTWVWFDPCWNAYGLVLASEMFDEVPEGEMFPIIDTI